jgi:alkanesulfonate monooxygenase SsuD/methylene tetrahydromethanopterin reductase-like flavin-dependent oxidoreductase (luciferase family)
VEGLGYSHIMIPEDYFYVPALVGATLALQATETVPVGTSIVSGLVRHPAVLAMEIAGISRAFPGGFVPASACPTGCGRWGSCRQSRLPPCVRA